MGSKVWSVCAQVTPLQLITSANDNGRTFGRFNLLTKSFECKWKASVYFLKHVISCVIKISVGQVQLRGLHATSMGCFKITAVIFRGNNSILNWGSSQKQTELKSWNFTFYSICYPFIVKITLCVHLPRVENVPFYHTV